MEKQSVEAIQIELFEAAKQMMDLAAKMSQAADQLQALSENKAEAHYLVAQAIDVAVKPLDKIKKGNDAFLDEMVENVPHNLPDMYIAGVKIDAKSYVPKETLSYAATDNSAKVRQHILKMIAEHAPDAIQMRIVSSKVTPQLMEACAGLLMSKSTDAWSIVKPKV